MTECLCLDVWQEKVVVGTGREEEGETHTHTQRESKGIERDEKREKYS